MDNRTTVKQSQLHARDYFDYERLKAGMRKRGRIFALPMMWKERDPCRKYWRKKKR